MTLVRTWGTLPATTLEAEGTKEEKSQQRYLSQFLRCRDRKETVSKQVYVDFYLLGVRDPQTFDTILFFINPIK